MINSSEVIMSQHKNTAHIHREPDLTHTAAVIVFSSLFFCYESAVCVCDVGERPRPSGGSFPRDRAWTHPLRSVLTGAARRLSRRVLRLSGGPARAGLRMLLVLRAEERRLLWRLHGSLRHRPALRPEAWRPTAAPRTDPRSSSLCRVWPDRRYVSVQLISEHLLSRGQVIWHRTEATHVCLCIAFLEDTDITSDQGALHYLLGLNRPLDPQDMAEVQESIKAKVNAIRKKLIQQVLKPTGSSEHSYIYKPFYWLKLLSLYTFKAEFALYLRQERFDQNSSSLRFNCI